MQLFCPLICSRMMKTPCVVNFDAPGAASRGVDSTTMLPSGWCFMICVSITSSTSTPVCSRRLHCGVVSATSGPARPAAETPRGAGMLTYHFPDEGRRLEWCGEHHSSLVIFPWRHCDAVMITSSVVGGPDVAVFPDGFVHILAQVGTSSQSLL